MKRIVKTTMALAMLLPLAGCLDNFGWSKKEKTQSKSEKIEVAHHGPAAEKVGKCSHKGCTHDHSKDAKHHAKSSVKDDQKANNVKTQSMQDPDDTDSYEDDNDDAQIQSLNNDDDYDNDDQENYTVAIQRIMH